MIQFFDIPDALIKAVLTGWIEIQDIGRMDSAVLSKVLRRQFKRVAYTGNETYLTARCVDHSLYDLESGTSDSVPNTFMAWALNRRLNISDLAVTMFVLERYRLCKAYLVKHGNSIKRIVFKGAAVHKMYKEWRWVLRDICANCPNVAILDCYHVRNFNWIAIEQVCSAWPHALKSISVYGERMIDPNFYTLCSRCKGLTDLTMSLTQVSPNGLFKTFEACGTQLLSIAGEFGDCDGVDAECFYWSLAHQCPNLRSFRLDAQHLRTPRLQDLLTGCPYLSELDLSFASLGDEGMASLALAGSRLTYLKLQETGVGNEAAVIEVVRPCSILRTLDITRCRCVTNCTILAVAESCPQIEVLHLRWNKTRRNRVEDGGVVALAGACPKLRQLCAADINISDIGLTALLTHCNQLTHLHIHSTRGVTDGALQVLPQRCVWMEYLNVKCCEGITAVGVRTIAQQCRRLRKLVVPEHLEMAARQAAAESEIFRPGLCFSEYP